MNDSKAILVIHPDSWVSVLVRSLLEDQGRNVLTNPSWPELVSDPPGDSPAIILMDRSYLDREGTDLLSLCRRKWNNAEVVLLPEGLEMPGTRAESMTRLLGHVDRLLSLTSSPA